MNLGELDEATIAEPVSTDPIIPCATFPFADGTNLVGNTSLEFDTWAQPVELSISVRFPTLDGRDAALPFDGGSVTIYQIGLTVAGRRNQFD